MRAAIVACSTDEDSATRGAKSELCQWDATAGGNYFTTKTTYNLLERRSHAAQTKFVPCGMRLAQVTKTASMGEPQSG